MISEQLLTWIIPGLIGYLFYHNTRLTIPIHKGNWDLLISIGVFSVFSRKIAWFTLDIAGAPTSGPDFSTKYIVSASIISVVLGTVASLAYNFFVEVGKIYDPTDYVSQFCRANIGKPVMVILKSKKMYCGFLGDYDIISRGESFSDRSIIITPFLSATYNGKNIENVKEYKSEDVKSLVKPVVIFTREVESLRLYDADLFEHFTSANTGQQSD